jgi:nicotinamide mononucleotide transporter
MWRVLYRTNAFETKLEMTFLPKRKNIYWFIFLGVITIFYCIITQTSFFLSTVLLSGIICVSLTAIGIKEAYLVGLYNSVSYSWIAFQNGLYGEVGLNILFYLPTGILGYIMWRKKTKNGIVIMQKLSFKKRLILILASVCSIAILGKILSLIPSQNTPFIDATTNILSIFATILMMWRYAEQWLMYITLNIVTIAMWIVRWQSEGYAGDAMIFMWSLYLVNSVFGFIVWSRGSATKLKTA